MISLKAAFAVTALLVSVPALADQGYSPNNNSTANPSYSAPRVHRERGARRMTTEQRIMFRMTMRDQMRGMAHDQRREFRQKQRDQFRALSHDEQQQRLADLEQQWNAMPQAKRDQLMQRFQARQQRRQDRINRRSGTGGQGQPTE